MSAALKNRCRGSLRLNWGSSAGRFWLLTVDIELHGDRLTGACHSQRIDENALDHASSFPDCRSPPVLAVRGAVWRLHRLLKAFTGRSPMKPFYQPGGRTRQAVDCRPADHPSDCRIMAETFGIARMRLTKLSSAAKPKSQGPVNTGFLVAYALPISPQ
jgi:hypothetical protein